MPSTNAFDNDKDGNDDDDDMMVHLKINNVQLNFSPVANSIYGDTRTRTRTRTRTYTNRNIHDVYTYLFHRSLKWKAIAFNF